MRIAKCLIIVVLLATLAPGAEEKLSNTREAVCIVKITVDPSIVPLNPQTLDYLLLSSGIAGKAAQDVLDLRGDAAALVHRGILFEWLQQSTHRSEQQAMPGASGGRGGRGRRTTKDDTYDEMMKEAAINRDRYTNGPSSDDSAPNTKGTDQPDAPGIMMGGGGMRGGMGGMGGGMGGGMMASVGGGMMSRGMGGGMYGDGMYGGGVGGGMGGGMGGMMGGAYGGSAPVTAPKQSVMLKLSVELPEDAKPAAQEFLKALVDNLQKALWNAYDEHAKGLKEVADFAESRREDAAALLDMAMGVQSPERMVIEEQLDIIVDLSILTPEMPVAEAFEHVKNAVQPPLPLVVMWRELLDNCEIEPTTPIDMDGLPAVRLRTGLKALVEAIGGGSYKVSYQVEDGVVIVRDAERQTVQSAPTVTTTQIDIQGLAARRHELTRQLERLEMDLATKAAREQAIQEQIARIRAETEDKLARDTVTQEMQKLVQMSSDHLKFLQRQYEAGTQGSTELNEARANLTRAKIELARRREELSKTTGGTRLVELNKDLSVMAIDEAEMSVQLQIVRRQLEKTEQQWKQASRFDPRAARIRVAKEALDLADRRVLELKRRLASLQPPTVTMIGAN